MKRTLLGVTAAVFLLVAFASHMPDRQMGFSATAVPSVAVVVLSAQVAASHDDASVRTASAATGQVLSLADIIGIILFLALIVTHFFLCRKGIYPESSCMCEPPRWLKKMLSRANRGTAG